MARLKAKPDRGLEKASELMAAGGRESPLEALRKENALLKRRILEIPETFFLQAHFFESLLTLNEIHLLQALVEATAHFLKAGKITFYQFLGQQGAFVKAASFRSTEGLSIDRNTLLTDRILVLVKKSRLILSIREILHDQMLYKIWHESASKALIYCPILLPHQLVGILTVDEIPFHRLNRETIKNLGVISRLAARALKNVRSHQRIVAEKNLAQSRLLSEYQQFLKTFNFEFKRARRNDLPLSLIYIVLESRGGQKGFEKIGISLARKIKNNCKKNVREIDLLFEDDTPGRFWLILPMTDFGGLAYVLERLNLLINKDLAGQSHYLCHFGFSSLDPDLKHPKQMMETCKESYQLHRTVRLLLNKKKERS